MSANPQPEIMQVDLTWKDSIAILTINNIARRNAWSVPIKEGFLRHMKALSADKKCRGIVITGTGGVFCAGGAMAAPISSAGTIALETTAEFVQWHQPHRRHVGPRHRRCWWENRRVRDHRGRWVVRRVQVCR